MFYFCFEPNRILHLFCFLLWHQCKNKYFWKYFFAFYSERKIFLGTFKIDQQISTDSNFGWATTLPNFASVFSKKQNLFALLLILKSKKQINRLKVLKAWRILLKITQIFLIQFILCVLCILEKSVILHIN